MRKSGKETMKFLSSIGINVIDYSFDEEMQTIEKLLK
jgi:hypothetical protein